MQSQALNEHAAAQRLGVAVQTLRNWRHLRRGPVYHKIGKRKIIYLQEEIEAFRDRGRIDPESGTTVAGR